MDRREARRESLYLETHSQRYELFEGDVEAVDDGGEGLVGEVVPVAGCLKPKPLAETRRLEAAPEEELETVKSGSWEDVKFSAGSVSIAGEEVNVVRLQFLSRT